MSLWTWSVWLLEAGAQHLRWYHKYTKTNLQMPRLSLSLPPSKNLVCLRWQDLTYDHSHWHGKRRIRERQERENGAKGHSSRGRRNECFSGWKYLELLSRVDPRPGSCPVHFTEMCTRPCLGDRRSIVGAGSVKRQGFTHTGDTDQGKWTVLALLFSSNTQTKTQTQNQIKTQIENQIQIQGFTHLR